MAVEYDKRHRRVLELLILHGELTFESLQTLAKLRRSDDQFGLIMGDLAQKRNGRRDTGKPVEWWHADGTRWYRVRPSILAEMVQP